jgi:hypothetical protein
MFPSSGIVLVYVSPDEDRWHEVEPLHYHLGEAPEYLQGNLV